MGREIGEYVKRMLYAESMGRCMNPSCNINLFRKNGDIIEKAHLIPYCDSKDNSFENLVVLCPNCHTDFDKNTSFTKEQVALWKKIRKEELDKVFCEKFGSFDELRERVAPILEENKTIYENYYLSDKKELWNIFEGKILANNSMLKKLLERNRGLIQKHNNKNYSNLAIIDLFLLHIAEFESTRQTDKKCRQVLFPKKINSLFGIAPIEEGFLPSVESLELLISQLQNQDKFIDIVLGVDNPFIEFVEDGKKDKLYLNDVPRLRQFYHEFRCFRAAEVRFDSLNYACSILRNTGIQFKFSNPSNIREVSMKDKKIVFVYKYCLSKVDIMKLSPTENTIVVNLHNWNGEGCISSEAHKFADEIDVSLITTDGLFKNIRKLKYDR